MEHEQPQSQNAELDLDPGFVTPPPPAKRIKLQEVEDADAQDSVGATSPVYLDVQGDLTLILGKNKTKFVVDANALRRSSSEFSELIEEALLGDEPNKIVQLDNAYPDAVKAMEVLLNIVHAKFDKVPEKPDFNLLHNIVLLADHYDMVNSLQPWAQTWADSMAYIMNDDIVKIEDLQAMTCLYHLRKLPEFAKLLVQVITNTTMSESGHLSYLAPSGVGVMKTWKKGMSPNSGKTVLISQASSLREDALQSLLDVIQGIMEVCTLDEEECPWCKHCALYSLGIIHKHLFDAKLSPLPQARDINMSPAELYNLVSSIFSDISSELEKHCPGSRVSIMIMDEPATLGLKCVIPQELNELLDVVLVLGNLTPKVHRAFSKVFRVIASKLANRNKLANGNQGGREQ